VFVADPKLTSEKENKKAYTISIKHFITLAQITASTSPNIIVPRAILYLLDDVISLRKEVSAMAGGASQGDHEGHVYFIAVLEEVREILKPLWADDLTAALIDESPSLRLGFSLQMVLDIRHVL
jgi:hypothetical protein